MATTTFDQTLTANQVRIQQAARRATLRASAADIPDFDPLPPFRRQPLPAPPPVMLWACARPLAEAA